MSTDTLEDIVVADTPGHVAGGESPAAEATPQREATEAQDPPHQPTAPAVGPAAHAAAGTIAVQQTAPTKPGKRKRSNKIPKLTKLTVGKRTYTVSGTTMEDLKARHSTGLHKLENLRRG